MNEFSEIFGTDLTVEILGVSAILLLLLYGTGVSLLQRWKTTVDTGHSAARDFRSRCRAGGRAGRFRAARSERHDRVRQGTIGDREFDFAAGTSSLR